MRTLVVFLLLVGATGAVAQEFEAGVHYQALPVPVETSSSGEVEVVEVFSYACVHCFNFEPLLDTWRAGQTGVVAFHRTPAIFNETWQKLAQAYYAAEALGVTDQIHVAMFEAIHVTGENVLDQSVLAGLFEENAGVDPGEFERVYASFAVRSKVQQASARGRAYRVTGVPSMIVNGKYRVDTRMAGGNEQMLAVVDFLVARERAAAAPVATRDTAAGS